MKKINVVIILVVCVVVVAVIANLWLNNLSFANDIEVKQAQTPVANIATYGSQLIQINDKLYYSADSYNNPILYGIYEIESGKSKRIWWDGLVSPLNINAGKGLLFEHNGELAEYDSDNDVVYLFDNKIKNFNYSNDYTYMYAELLKSIESSTGKNVHPTELCVFGDKVYYVYEDSNLVWWLYEFDSDNCTETALYNTSKEKSAIVNYLYTYDGCVYLEYSNYYSEILCIRHNPVTKETTLIQSNDYTGVPITDNIGVLCTYDEIYAVDRNSGEKTLIAQTNGFMEVFLFDKNWVYYSPTNNSLWRVTLDGLITEKVF